MVDLDNDIIPILIFDGKEKKNWNCPQIIR